MSEHKLITNLKKYLKSTKLHDDVIALIISFICPRKYQYVELRYDMVEMSIEPSIDIRREICVRYCANCKQAYYSNITNDDPRIDTVTHLTQCSAKYNPITNMKCTGIAEYYRYEIFDTIYRKDDHVYTVFGRNVLIKDQDGEIIKYWSMYEKKCINSEYISYYNLTEGEVSTILYLDR